MERTLIPVSPRWERPLSSAHPRNQGGDFGYRDRRLKLEKSGKTASLAVGETKTVDMDAVIEEASTSQPTIIAGTQPAAY